MDRITKILLSVIAVSLITLNIQIAAVSTRQDSNVAAAEKIENGLEACAKEFGNIAYSIRNQLRLR